ncbi:MAG TPA: diguanylate cyclase [Candidatus Acidoferrales bacterium]|nr:diguanylate cyclase [Candidatus Acidoferrales bacterium]
MLDDIFGTPQRGARTAERLDRLRSFLKRLDTELPQVIVEALEEAARVTAADVAAIFEVRSGVLHCAFSTDPSLLEVCVEIGKEQELHERGTSLLRSAAGVADALCAMLYTGDHEWVLLLGERTSKLDRKLFQADIETLLDVFAQLLRQRSLGVDARSLVDHVTSLPDRWATMNRLSETISAAKRNGTHAALLFIDLNGFKGVNDSFGHAHGDLVLKTIATTLRDALRANEFVGRIGGDEFAVILPVVRSSDEATLAAKRLADGVRELEIVHGTGSVSLSVGVAFYPEHATTVEDWLHHADLAMYAAKRQRESHCVFNPGDMSADWTPLAIEIEEAYAREFLLCFQPIFDVETGSVVAAEALLRSLHPQDGVQSAFITMESARARRSIEHLDAWVTRRALACANEWRELGVARIHVNIGQAGDEILSNVLRAIDGSGCDTSMLALELDWSRFTADYEAYHALAEAAERCGLYVGLDGFGDGDLDLAKLEALSVRFVKPSRALLPSGGSRGRGMEALVALARVYGWDVIATRVATADDRAAIRAAGVKYMQGFAVAQPMTAIDFNQWIESSPRIALVS